MIAGDTPITESANSIWETLVEALPRLAVAVTIVVVGWFLSRVVRWILRGLFSRRRSPSFARVISAVSAWLFVLVVVLLAVAVTFPSVRPVDLLAGVGFFSVAVGFAFQDILENTLAGVLLLFRQPFRAGDQVEVVDQTGTVVEINIRDTHLTTFDGEAVIIPNRDVYKNVIVVHTYHDTHRVQFEVGVSYGCDLTAATAAIVDALSSVPVVAADPPPSAMVGAFGESSIDIQARFWTNSRRWESLVALDTAIKAVKRRLDAEGINIPFPIRVLESGSTFAAVMDRRGRPEAPGT